MDEGFHCNTFEFLMEINEMSIHRKMNTLWYSQTMECHLTVKVYQLELHVSACTIF